VPESAASLTVILSRLAECQVRLSSTVPAGLAPADVMLLSEQLAEVEKELRGWAQPPRRAPTPPTLRTLLWLARADLAAELSGEATPTEQLARVVCLAVRLVPCTEHAGVSMQRGGQQVENLAATRPVATACDQARHELGEGPLPQVGAIHGLIPSMTWVPNGAGPGSPPAPWRSVCAACWSASCRPAAAAPGC